jgi:hypothetical protein
MYPPGESGSWRSPGEPRAGRAALASRGCISRRIPRRFSSRRTGSAQNPICARCTFAAARGPDQVSRPCERSPPAAPWGPVGPRTRPSDLRPGCESPRTESFFRVHATGCCQPACPAVRWMYCYRGTASTDGALHEGPCAPPWIAPRTRCVTALGVAVSTFCLSLAASMAALQLAAGAKGKRLRAGEGINIDRLRDDLRARVRRSRSKVICCSSSSVLEKVDLT